MIFYVELSERTETNFLRSNFKNSLYKLFMFDYDHIFSDLN